MNQVSDENLQNVKCNQKYKSTKNVNKKAKDPSESTNETSDHFNQENLNEALANTLNIKVNSNLTNGTSAHSVEEVTIGSIIKSEAQDAVLCEVTKHVNRLQYTEESVAGNCNSEATCSSHNNGEGECHMSSNSEDAHIDDIDIISYESELQMPEIMRLIQKDLSEPYSIYTYRYFIHNWPKLCFLATHEGKCIGAIVCKLDMHRNVVKRGYIAMLAVDKQYRKRRIGSRLVEKAIQAMINDNADEVVLETEITNKPALKLYENLGFVRDKRLFRYYLNGVDALRLKLWLR
ncbi:N-alpha-acetyltransferase 30, NatC catalytic subunit [Papilio machaon]|uniref:N-terminal methionine N(alpha)-acetyltransferase NatC n=1 Tax=Papilio machaon TaxID=76193 RepID=A0A194RRR6_PAPMA|nr:N-alpha-acetyltransferase 30, NatC catalytic subunit [Papilio machaon]